MLPIEVPFKSIPMLDLKYIFQHHYILNTFTFQKEDNFDERSCICKACLLQGSSLAHIHKVCIYTSRSRKFQ